MLVPSFPTSTLCREAAAPGETVERSREYGGEAWGKWESGRSGQEGVVGIGSSGF